MSSNQPRAELEITPVGNPPGDLAVEVLPNSAIAPDNDHEWILSERGKWFYYKEPGIRQYQSGTIYQEGKGIIASPPSAMITSDTAASMIELKMAAKRRALEDGAKQAIADKRKLSVTELSDNSIASAYSEHLMKAAMADRAPNQVAALRLVGETFEFMPDKRGVAQPSDGSVTLSLTGSVEDIRKAMSARYQQREVVEDGDTV